MERYEDYLSGEANLGHTIHVAVADINEELVKKQRREELTFNFIDKPLGMFFLLLIISVNLIYFFTDDYSILLLPSSLIAFILIYGGIKLIELAEIKLFPGRIHKKYDQVLETEKEILGIFENGLILGPFLTHEDHEFIPYEEIEEIDMKLGRPIQWNGSDYYSIRINNKDGSSYRINWEEFIYLTYPLADDSPDVITRAFVKFHNELSKVKSQHNL